MRRIAAHYLFPAAGKPLPRGFVTLNDENVIIETGVLQNETESTEFYNGILAPGFVNAHGHLELAHMKGACTPHTGLAGFIRQMNSPARYGAEAAGRSAAMAAADREMQAEGVVAAADICNTADSFAVKQHSPVFYHSFIELAGLDEATGIKKLQAACLLAAGVQSMGLAASITPHAAYSMHEQLLAAAFAAANAAGIVSVHNQESEEENELFRTGGGALGELFAQSGYTLPPVTGERSIYRLLPYIDKQTHTLLVHNVTTTEEDYEAAASRLPCLTWVLCPLSNLHISRRLPPADRFWKRNAQVAIGTDSLASNSRLSIIEELKTIHKHFPQIPLHTLLQWATVNGARALNKEREFGSLCVGKRPGVVLIENIDFTNMQLTNDSKVTLLAGSHGNDIIS
ncbi:MAG: amidohydrolase family protein [Prevotellaceae bacterium]|jgi:cytosine/adenosine deaminase-related metal-dependent hydrolase|nr:amidohydrolase family protein [Prevotellaceae bacterium]